MLSIFKDTPNLAGSCINFMVYSVPSFNQIWDMKDCICTCNVFDFFPVNLSLYMAPMPPLLPTICSSTYLHLFSPDMGVRECYTSYNPQGSVFGNCGHTSTDYIPCAQRYLFLCMSIDTSSYASHYKINQIHPI